MGGYTLTTEVRKAGKQALRGRPKAKIAPPPRIFQGPKVKRSPARSSGYRAGAAAEAAGYHQRSVVFTPAARRGAADQRLLTGLPPEAGGRVSADVQATYQSAKLAPALAQRMPYFFSPADRAAVQRPGFADRETAARVQHFRSQVADIHTNAQQTLADEAMVHAKYPGLASLTPSQSLHQIEQGELQNLGKPDRTFLNNISDALNSGFSGYGNLIEGNFSDAGKQIVSFGQWGRASSVGSALVKRGLVSEDVGLATDILLPAVATPELGGLGGFAATGARIGAEALEGGSAVGRVAGGGARAGLFAEGAAKTRLGIFAQEALPRAATGGSFGFTGREIAQRGLGPKAPRFQRFTQPTFEPTVPKRVGQKGEAFGPELAPPPEARQPPQGGPTKVSPTQQRLYERGFSKGDPGAINRPRQIRAGGKPLSQVFGMGARHTEFPKRLVGEPARKAKLSDVNVKWRGKPVQRTTYAPETEFDVHTAQAFRSAQAGAQAAAEAHLGFVIKPPLIVRGAMRLARKSPEDIARTGLKVPVSRALGAERGARVAAAVRKELHPTVEWFREMMQSRFGGAGTHPGVAASIQTSHRLTAARDQRWAEHVEGVFSKGPRGDWSKPATTAERHAASHYAEGTLRLSPAEEARLADEAAGNPTLEKQLAQRRELSKLADSPRVKELGEWWRNQAAPGMVREAHRAGLRVPERPMYVPHINDPQALYDQLGVKLHVSADQRKGGLGGGYNPLHKGSEERRSLHELQAGGLKPETDLKRIALTRGQAHNRMMADAAVSKRAAETGRFAPGKAGRHPPPGEIILSAPTRTGTIKDPHTGQVILGSGGKRRVIPQEVWQTLQKAYGPRGGLEEALGGGQAVTKAGRFFRGWAANWKRLKLATTAHDVTNIIGDVFRAGQEGYFPPGVRALFQGGKGRTLAKTGLRKDEFAYLMDALGATSGGQLAHEIHAATRGEVPLARTSKERLYGKGGVLGKATSKLTWPVRAGVRGYGHLRVVRENIPRRSTALQSLRKTGAPMEAARESYRVHFDYGDPGRAIEVARRSPVGIPFATWMLRNLPAQYASLGRNLLGGGLLGSTLQAQKGLAAGQSFATQAPWTQENTLFNLAGRFWGANLPSSDLNRFGDPLHPAQSLQNIAGSAGPLVQLGAILTGKNLGTWRSLSDNPVATNPVTGLVARAAGEGDTLAQRFDERGNPVRGQSGINSQLDALVRLFLPTGAVTGPTAVGALTDAPGGLPGAIPQGVRALTGISSTPTLKYREQLGGNIARAQIAIRDAKEAYYRQRKLAVAARMKPQERERRLADERADWFRASAKLTALLQYQRNFPRQPRSATGRR